MSKRLLSRLGRYWQNQAKEGNVTVESCAGSVRFGGWVRWWGTFSFPETNPPNQALGKIVSNEDPPKPTEYIYKFGQNEVGVTDHDRVWAYDPEDGGEPDLSLGYVKAKTVQAEQERSREGARNE